MRALGLTAVSETRAGQRGVHGHSQQSLIVPCVGGEGTRRTNLLPRRAHGPRRIALALGAASGARNAGESASRVRLCSSVSHFAEPPLSDTDGRSVGSARRQESDQRLLHARTHCFESICRQCLCRRRRAVLAALAALLLCVRSVLLLLGQSRQPGGWFHAATRSRNARHPLHFMRIFQAPFFPKCPRRLLDAAGITNAPMAHRNRIYHANSSPSEFSFKTIESNVVRCQFLIFCAIIIILVFLYFYLGFLICTIL